MKQKALFPYDSNPIPGCVTWLSECGLPPFFPQREAFVQCANHTTVRGWPWKVIKRSRRNVHKKVEMDMKKEGQSFTLLTGFPKECTQSRGYSC